MALASVDVDRWLNDTLRNMNGADWATATRATADTPLKRWRGARLAGHSGCRRMWTLIKSRPLTKMVS